MVPHLFTGKSWDVTYRQVLKDILARGEIVSPREMPCKEVLGSVILIEDALETIMINEIRSLNYRFMAVEALWIAAAENSLEPLLRVNSQYGKFSDDGKTLAGAYGPRLGRQLDYIVAKLLEDDKTRQAVATIWTENPKPSKDIPCTVSVQFLVRENALHSIWTMRSSDAWLGLPYDIFSFSFFQSYVAALIKKPVGSLQLHIGSSHLYKEHWDFARDAADFDSKSLSMPASFNQALLQLEISARKPGKRECLEYLVNNWSK